MSRKRCKLTKDEYSEKNTDDAVFCCKKCGRAAKKKSKLCDPKKNR